MAKSHSQECLVCHKLGEDSLAAAGAFFREERPSSDVMTCNKLGEAVAVAAGVFPLAGITFLGFSDMSRLD